MIFYAPGIPGAKIAMKIAAKKASHSWLPTTRQKLPSSIQPSRRFPSGIFDVLVCHSMALEPMSKARNQCVAVTAEPKLHVYGRFESA